ncbi:Predicted Zn-dependent protease (DUF2268) [Lysinibacillus sphaericus]|nr:Predicted Zn-dependent protease (DUF2268) [Lysinibacillus sphaericus]
MRKLIVLFFTLSILTLLGCSNDPEESSPSRENNGEASEEAIQNSVKEEVATKKNVPNFNTFTYNGQKFEIVYFYQSFIDYLEKAKEQPDNLDELYLETVINPLGGGDGQWILQQWGFGTPTRPALLDKYLQSLIENHDTIKDLIINALKDSADQLQPGVTKYVYVLPANPDDAFTLRRNEGVAGTAWDQSFMTIQIAPPFLKESNLKFAVAHEYHHTVFLENNNLTMEDSLLDFVLIEGKADTFARIIYPDIQTPWSGFSTGTDEIQTWQVLQKNVSSTDSLIKDLFFHGDGVKGLPRWANYKIGNKIMESFIDENTNVSITDWTNMSSDEVLEKSKYSEKH